jgi:hypothetical protein
MKKYIPILNYKNTYCKIKCNNSKMGVINNMCYNKKSIIEIKNKCVLFKDCYNCTSY